eukprot:359594-Chlamydomonas_euryale.AAC.1
MGCAHGHLSWAPLTGCAHVRLIWAPLTGTSHGLRSCPSHMGTSHGHLSWAPLTGCAHVRLLWAALMPGQSSRQDPTSHCAQGGGGARLGCCIYCWRLLGTAGPAERATAQYSACGDRYKQRHMSVEDIEDGVVGVIVGYFQDGVVGVIVGYFKLWI